MKRALRVSRPGKPVRAAALVLALVTATAQACGMHGYRFQIPEAAAALRFRLGCAAALLALGPAPGLLTFQFGPLGSMR